MQITRTHPHTHNSHKRTCTCTCILTQDTFKLFFLYFGMRENSVQELHLPKRKKWQKLPAENADENILPMPEQFGKVREQTGRQSGSPRHRFWEALQLRLTQTLLAPWRQAQLRLLQLSLTIGHFKSLILLLQEDTKMIQVGGMKPAASIPVSSSLLVFNP